MTKTTNQIRKIKYQRNYISVKERGKQNCALRDVTIKITSVLLCMKTLFGSLVSDILSSSSKYMYD